MFSTEPKGGRTMKISIKMILVFSLLVVLTTAFNAIMLFKTQQNLLNSAFINRYSDTGGRIIGELEQYVANMEMALDEVTADVEFMNAFARASSDSQKGELHSLLAAQNVMSRAMYRSPIITSFYRVDVFTRSGFFLGSRFEKNATAVSMSDEIQEIIAEIPWLEYVEEHPYKKHLLGVHMDEWNTTGQMPVFSVVRAAMWYGQHVGFVEVSEPFSALEEIFTGGKDSDMFIQAVFHDGKTFFCQENDHAVYGEIPVDTLTSITLQDGSKRNVMRMQSKKLGMDIYVAQDLSVYNQQYRESVVHYLIIESALMVGILVIIILTSLGMTRSIRSLTRKVQQFPTDALMAHEIPMAHDSFVTRKNDIEIHNLEQVVNKLVNRLHLSVHNEMAMRESTLQAQLNALQTQINPHFIYNTLNIIAAKSFEESEAIPTICSELSKMLRYATDTHSREATLGDEVHNVESYLAVVKARYEDNLNYTISIPEEMYRLWIPKLTLQPIVENALQHGFHPDREVQEISVIGRIENGLLHLLVRDNGTGFEDNKLAQLQRMINKIEANADDSSDAFDGGSIGLRNTCLRLHHYSNGRMHMLLHNDNGAVVELTFPTE